MHIYRKMAVLLGGSAGLGLIQGSPSLARDLPFGSTCSSNTSLSSLIASGGCNIGDKNFTNFSYSFSGGAGPSASGVNVSITEVLDQYTAVFSANSPGAWQVGGTGFISYTITVNTNSADYLNTASGAFNSSLGGSAYTWNTTATSSSGTCSGNQLVNSCAGAGNPPPLSFAFGVETSTISNNISGISSQGIQAIQNAFTQQPVPGPLPMLGAGAAFGFSRKLRQRLKSVA
jgi:hypothetical protein